MATVQPDGYSYVLMEDVQGEKAPGRFKTALKEALRGTRFQGLGALAIPTVTFAPMGKHVQLLRGELLTPIPQRDMLPRNDGRPAHNFRSKKDPSVTLHVCDDANVAPAKGKEVQLLEAIERPYNRFTVFSIENRLEWGSSLGKGDQVFVKIPTPNTSVPTWSVGLVQYAGPVEGLPGWNFGVEIKDSHYLGRGSTDGVFGGYRYFRCDENCGLFVSLENLAPELPPSHGKDQKNKEQSEQTNQQKLQLQQQVDSLLAEKKNLQQKNEELVQQTDQQKQQLQQSFTQLAEKEQEIQQLEYQNQHFRAENERLLQESGNLRQQKQDLQLRLDAARAPESSVSGFTKVQIPRQDQDSWNVRRREVVLQERLGHGAWGSVCKGVFRGQQVAVKCAHEEILYDTTIDQLKREIRIMAHIQHPNLVRLIAAVVDKSVEEQTQSPLLILELLDTDLRSAYKKKVVNLCREVLLPIFRDVAYALHYLHEHQEPIIHRDVSAPNVLLQQTHPGVWKAKLSDFGSANLAKHCKTAGPGAFIYSAPETFPNIQPPPKQTTKIDVYSYGYLLAESIAKEMPSPEKRAVMLPRIKQEWAPIHAIILACTEDKPESRLTMTQVLEKLHSLPPVIN